MAFDLHFIQFKHCAVIFLFTFPLSERLFFSSPETHLLDGDLCIEVIIYLYGILFFFFLFHTVSKCYREKSIVFFSNIILCFIRWQPLILNLMSCFLTYLFFDFQIEVLHESRSMIPDTVRRLKVAWKDLDELLVRISLILYS